MRVREHSTVNHSASEYFRKVFHHTNIAKNFLSIFKRGVIDAYRHMSEADLGRYCAELDLRYNTRDMNDAKHAREIRLGGVGRRLTSRRTVSSPAKPAKLLRQIGARRKRWTRD